MPKNVVETEGPQMTSRYGSYALRVGLGRLHAHMHMPTRAGTHTHARTHSHACTQRPIINTCCFFTATIIRERNPLLRFLYVASLVDFIYVTSLNMLLLS